MKSRKKQLIITVFSNLILQLITAVCGFILPPLIVESFGSTVNGMVSSIAQFISYLNIVEAGIGAASIAALYLPLSKNDFEGLNGILSATKKFYNKSGYLFSFLVFLLAIVYPFFVGSQVKKLSAFLMVLVLGITGTAEFFLIGKYRVLLTADKKVYVLSLVQSFAVIVNTIVAVIAIKLGEGILTVKLLSALVYLSRYIFLHCYVKSRYKWVRFDENPNTEAISQSKNVLVHQLAGLIVFNSPIIILTILCSLKDVSVYAVYAMIFTAVSSFLNAFANGMQSFFGESLVKDSLEKSRSFFLKYRMLFLTIAYWFYSMTFLLILPFMSIYTKNMTDTNYIQPKLAVLFVFVGILNNLRLPEIQLINAAGHFKKTQNKAIIELSLNLIFSIVCTIKYGFVGVLIGSIISGLYRDFDAIVYVSRKIIKNNVLISISTTLLLFIIYGSIVYALSFIKLNITTYIDWTQIAVIYGIILSIPVLLVLLWSFVRKKKQNE